MTAGPAPPDDLPPVAERSVRDLRDLIASSSLSGGQSPGTAARRLLRARVSFDREPARFAALWPRYLDAVLAPHVAAELSAGDLASLERTALLVWSRSQGRLDLDRAVRPVREAQGRLAEAAAEPRDGDILTVLLNVMARDGARSGDAGPAGGAAPDGNAAPDGDTGPGGNADPREGTGPAEDTTPTGDTGPAGDTAPAEDTAPDEDGGPDEPAELGTALSWLGDLAAGGPAPVTAARLRELASTEALGGRVPGERLRYAAGRLSLIEGDIWSAAGILAPLARAHPERPSWVYHAASALALCGDAAQVSELWETVRTRPHAWPAGCQLAEADPGTAGSVLRDARVPSAYADAVAARAALCSWAEPPVPPTAWRPGGGTACEDTEAFRTCLALWLLHRDRRAIQDALALPVFARLPGPERMLWAAISLLPRSADDGRSLLLHADALGHPRAKLVLALLDLADGDHVSAAALLARLTGVRGPLPELLRAWSDVSAGRPEQARRWITRLANAGDARARYALAGGDLLRAARSAAGGQPGDARRHAARAGRRFRDLLADGPPRFADEAGVLLHCAELAAAEPVSAPAGHLRLRREIPGWPTPARGIQIRWAAAIARVSAEGDIPDLVTARSLADGISLADEPAEAAVSAVAALLCRAGLASSRPEDARILLGLLSRLTSRLPGNAAVRRAHEVAAAALIRLDDAYPGTQPAPPGTRGAVVSLALAERALRAGDTAAAADVLRAASPVPGEEDGDADKRCRTLAGLLEELPGPTDTGPADTGPGDTGPADMLSRGKSLLSLARRRDTSALVDLSGYLPALCAAIGAGRDREVPAPVSRAVRDLTGDSGGGLSTVVSARCATAIGDHETAHRLWVRVLRDRDGMVPPELREEMSGALRHAAVLARRQGDDLRAIWSLRVALEFGLAGTLELQVAAGRLADALFPWSQGCRDDRPGRYRVLEEAIDAAPALKTALLSDDPARITAAWAACLRARQDDLRFLHAVAVLYRENGLRAAGRPEADGILAIATVLWSLLLGTDAFWHRFAGLEPEAGLTDRVLADLLAGHTAAGGRALGDGDEPAAAAHLRVLTACGTGHDSLTRQLGDRLGIDWRWRPGPGTGQVSALADAHLAEWGTSVTRDARDVLDDTDGLDLPKGIVKNYEGAVRALEAFAALGMRARREVALTGLELCNEWCDEYAQEPDGVGVRTVLHVFGTAGKFADQLMQVTPKGESQARANQVISFYYQMRAWAANSRADKYRYFTEALDWNPSNGFALRKRKQYGDAAEPAGG